MPRPKRNSWVGTLAEMAGTMRQLGVLSATRRVVTKAGTTEEWSLSLGPPAWDAPAPVPFTASADNEAAAKAAAREHKRQRIYDATNHIYPDDMLDLFPDSV